MANGTSSRPSDVVDATLERSGDRGRVAATTSSPYDSPDRYADAFRVLAPDGTVLGVRELLHDHANEQPLTRSLSGRPDPRRRRPRDRRGARPGQRLGRGHGHGAAVNVEVTQQNGQTGSKNSSTSAATRSPRRRDAYRVRGNRR